VKLKTCCPFCGFHLFDHTPTPGDFTVCFSCAYILQAGDDSSLHPADPEAMIRLARKDLTMFRLLAEMQQVVICEKLFGES
jgi:hypothetical protein